MKLVARYGIHWGDDGIAYLHQPLGNMTALGLKEKSPFRVMSPVFKVSSDLDPTKPLKDSELTKLGDLIHSPLLKAMEPLPGGGLFQVELSKVYTVRWMLYMCGAPYSVVTDSVRGREDFLNIKGRAKLQDLLSCTNVVPLVIHIGQKDVQWAKGLIETFERAPRKVCLIPPENVWVPNVLRVQPPDNLPQDLTKQIMAKYGNRVIREYMLGGPPT